MQQPKIQNSKIKIISVQEMVPQSEIQQRPSIPKTNNTFRTIQQNQNRTKNSVKEIPYHDIVNPQKQIRSISSNIQTDINKKIYLKTNDQHPIKEYNHQPSLSTQFTKQKIIGSVNSVTQNQNYQNFQPIKNENQNSQPTNYQKKISIQTVQHPQISDNSKWNNNYTKNFQVQQNEIKLQNCYENQLSDQPSDLAESLARSISYKCKLCDINIDTDIIQLACFHFYHKECFIQHIDSQINSKQCQMKCFCGIKIREGEIKKFLSLDNKSKQIDQLLRLQVKQIFFKYNCFQQCKFCGFFWKSNQQISQLPCKQCSNIDQY